MVARVLLKHLRNKPFACEADAEAGIREAKRRKGMFVIATNELDAEALTDHQLLLVYKDQSVTVERGFRFLKDPMFYAESLYPKSPKRIMALIMVMTLSLLVYALAEQRVRGALAATNEHIWDQKDKPTEAPDRRQFLSQRRRLGGPSQQIHANHRRV